jgi:uncharacterized protein
MPGTKAGGLKAAETNKKRYGPTFYVRIGALGGKKSIGGAFAKDRELASRAGKKGGKRSGEVRAARAKARLATLTPEPAHGIGKIVDIVKRNLGGTK